MSATLRGSYPEWAANLERGARRPWGAVDKWATFVRPIPRAKPPPVPAGLASTLREALVRWKAHQFRYPPYQYKLENMVKSGAWGCQRAPGRTMRLRPLTSCERAVRLGFPWDHCFAAVKKSEGLGLREAADVRCGLLGNT